LYFISIGKRYKSISSEFSSGKSANCNGGQFNNSPIFVANLFFDFWSAKFILLLPDFRSKIYFASAHWSAKFILRSDKRAIKSGLILSSMPPAYPPYEDKTLETKMFSSPSLSFSIGKTFKL